MYTVVLTRWSGSVVRSAIIDVRFFWEQNMYWNDQILQLIMLVVSENMFIHVCGYKCLNITIYLQLHQQRVSGYVAQQVFMCLTIK